MSSLRDSEPLAEASILFEGAATTPRLDHPESVVVAADGSLWCGGEAGQIFRIADGEIELIASTDGFTLGITFLDPATIAVCDMARPAVWLLDIGSGELWPLPSSAPGHELMTPNAVVPLPDGSMLVSDSGVPHTPRPGIVRYWRDGRSQLWYEPPLNFANGMALSPDAATLYVAESWSYQVRAISVRPAGWSAGDSSVYASLGDVIPDGLCTDEDGTLIIGCYEPSMVVQAPAPGVVQLLAHDPTAHTLCHPTGVAVRGSEVVTANLGRWHLSSVPRPAAGSQ